MRMLVMGHNEHQTEDFVPLGKSWALTLFHLKPCVTSDEVTLTLISLSIKNICAMILKT